MPLCGYMPVQAYSELLQTLVYVATTNVKETWFDGADSVFQTCKIHVFLNCMTAPTFCRFNQFPFPFPPIISKFDMANRISTTKEAITTIVAPENKI